MNQGKIRILGIAPYEGMKSIMQKLAKERDDIDLSVFSLTGGIPFPITLPKAPAEINADNMTNSELRAAITAGYEEMEQGKVQNASAAFAAFHKTHK